MLEMTLIYSGVSKLIFTPFRSSVYTYVAIQFLDQSVKDTGVHKLNLTIHCRVSNNVDSNIVTCWLYQLLINMIQQYNTVMTK